jgi:hypothetical protein
MMKKVGLKNGKQFAFNQNIWNSMFYLASCIVICIAEFTFGKLS